MKFPLRFLILSIGLHVFLTVTLLFGHLFDGELLGPKEGQGSLISFALLESQPQKTPAAARVLKASRPARPKAEGPLANAVQESSSSEEQAQVEGGPTAAGESVVSHYLWEVRAIVEKNKFYPLSAKRLRQEDIVKTTFILNREGKVTQIESLKSSYETLSEAAKKLLTEKATFPVFPKELAAQTLKVSLDIRYHLD